MERNEIQYSKIGNILPYGYPFLMVDRVLDYTRLISIRGLKNVSKHEPYMKTNDQGDKQFPSGLVLESIGQLAGILHYLSFGRKQNCQYILGKISDVSILSLVFAGNQLVLEVTFQKVTSGFFIASGIAKNDIGRSVLTVGELIIVLK